MGKTLFMAMAVVLILPGLTIFQGVMARPLSSDCPVNQTTGENSQVCGSRLSPESFCSSGSPQFTGDTFKLLVIPVQWTNRPAAYSREVLEQFFFSTNVRPTGSVGEYFAEVSYGQITLTGTVTDWYNAGGYPTGVCPTDDFYINILRTLDAVIDYSQFDGNHDGVVDGIVFVIAGCGNQDTHDPNDP